MNSIAKSSIFVVLTALVLPVYAATETGVNAADANTANNTANATVSQQERRQAIKQRVGERRQYRQNYRHRYNNPRHHYISYRDRSYGSRYYRNHNYRSYYVGYGCCNRCGYSCRNHYSYSNCGYTCCNHCGTNWFGWGNSHRCCDNSHYYY